jgi:O-antigen ligase
MNHLKYTQKYFTFLFIFSLNFAQMNFLNLGIDFLLTKITFSLFFFISILNIKSSYSFKQVPKYLHLIFLYFALLTIIGLINITASSYAFFDFPFFINLLTFIIFLNYSRTNYNILLKALFVFALSTFVLSILNLLGFAVSEELQGRFSVFGINMNILGISACISLLVIISIVFENRLNLGKKRFLLLLLLPFLLGLMISTGSRVSFISFVLSIFIFLYYNKYLGSLKKGLLVFIVATFFILFWIFFLKNSTVVSRLFDSVDNGDLSSRDEIWFNLFEIISNNYIFGVGKTGYALIAGESSPHNVLIEVLCYSGIIGLSIFLVFFFRIVGNAYRRMRFENELLPLALIIPISGMIMSGQIFDQKIVWLIFAYIVSRKVPFRKRIDLSNLS